MVALNEFDCASAQKQVTENCVCELLPEQSEHDVVLDLLPILSQCHLPPPALSLPGRDSGKNPCPLVLVQRLRGLEAPLDSAPLVKVAQEAIGTGERQDWRAHNTSPLA